MTEERLEEIFERTKFVRIDEDKAFLGLEILRKYKDYVLQAAEHDIIYSVDVADIIDELTEEDAVQLAKLGWHISEHGCFARFV